MQFKNLIRNLNLLNVLLLSALTFFVLYSIFPSFSTEVKYVIPISKKIIDEEDEQTEQTQIPSIAEYANISEDNLFHPERKIPVEKKEEQPLPKPDFVLYGTLITDDMRIAYMEDLKAPRSTAGRGKRQISMKKGDTMSGFTLKEIEADKIVMVRGEEKMTVPVNDPAHPKMRGSQGTVAQAPQQQRVPAANVQQPTSTPAARAGQRATVKQQSSLPADRRVGEGFGGLSRSQRRSPQ